MYRRMGLSAMIVLLGSLKAAGNTTGYKDALQLFGGGYNRYSHDFRVSKKLKARNKPSSNAGRCSRAARRARL